MKITNENLIRLAGLSALIAGVCYVLVGMFHPAKVASSVTTTRWEIVHILACAMSFFAVLGMTGLYARQAVKTGWLGLVGYVLLQLWFVLIMGFSFVEAFILPHVATSLPSFVQAWMGMFNGPAGTFDLGVLPTLWTLTAPAYILGGLFFGVATFRAGILPRWAGALLALSTLLAPIAALLPNAAQPKTAIPMGLALAWLGYALSSEQPKQPLAPPSREPAQIA
jgi:predicted DNA-binding transcriptional regulator